MNPELEQLVHHLLRQGWPDTTDRNGHVWQYLHGRLTSTMVEDVEPYRCCLRCGQIEALGDNDTWAVWTDGDGYCAELTGGAK